MKLIFEVSEEGVANREFLMEIREDSELTVEAIKHIVCVVQGIPVRAQTFVVSGKDLDDEDILFEKFKGGRLSLRIDAPPPYEEEPVQGIKRTPTGTAILQRAGTLVQAGGKVIVPILEKKTVKDTGRFARHFSPKIINEFAKRIPDFVEQAPQQASKVAGSSLSRSATLESDVPVMRVSDFCYSVLITPFYDSAEILEIQRRMVQSGVHHEYILAKVVGEGQGGTPDTRWIRVDRGAKGNGILDKLASRSASSSGQFASGDLIRVAQEGEYELVTQGSKIKAKVEFDQPAGSRPPLLALGHLLNVMEAESKKYKLFSENCWFYTSVIQDILTSFFNGKLVDGQLQGKTLGEEVRIAMKQSFEAMSQLSRYRSLLYEGRRNAPGVKW